MKNWTEYTKKELLQLPVRAWHKTSKYDSVLFVNSRQKHDSGYNLFAIVGCIKSVPIEIAGYMDDFRWDSYKKTGKFTDILEYGDIAFDCSMHGVFRMHTQKQIYVGGCVSTTEWWIDK